ncbi:MAG: hypothetical protein GX259_03500 [Bacteroidales bacterium]|nr:hypothetical protein [Bacteroidales bacterium]
MKLNFAWKSLLGLICILAIACLIFAYFLPQIYNQLWIWTILFLSAIYSLSFFIFLKTVGKNPKTSSLVFLALTVGKMLLAMIFFFVLVMAFDIKSLSFALFFAISYLSFLILEIIVFIREIKKTYN